MYEIASGPKDARPQEVYVHCQELGKQIKFIRRERLKALSETTDDDGKLRLNITF
jgi:hypothetical protein